MTELVEHYLNCPKDVSECESCQEALKEFDVPYKGPTEGEME